MDDKKQPPKGQPSAPTGNTGKSATRPASRHRFAEGETSIMPLADILRSRDANALLDRELSGSLTPQWSKANAGATAPPKGVGEQPESDAEGETQIVSGFADLRTPIRAFSATPAKSPSSPPTVASPGAAKKERPPVERPGGSDGASAGPKPPSLSQTAPPRDAATVATASPGVALGVPVVPSTAASPEAAGKSRSKAKARNQVIVFFSCKGGAGATALSVNAAHTYARDKLHSCLVDMDLQMGDALAALALKPKLTLAQAATGAAAGDRLARDRLPMHHSTVAVLSQVGSLDDLDTVSSENMAKLVEALRETFDTIVLDGVREFSDNVLAVLDVADKICLVTVQEVLSIRRARWAFNILRKIGFDPKDITVAVNRFDARSEVPLASLKSIFEPANILTVMSDALPVLQSLNRGVPLQEASPNRPVTRQMMRLAYNLSGNTMPEEQVDDAAPYEASLFKRMLKRFK